MIYIYYSVYYHPVYYFSFIYFLLCNQGREEDSNKNSNKEMVVLNNSDKLQSSSHTINRLHQSDPVKGQINIININKPSWSDDSGLLSNNKEFGI